MRFSAHLLCMIKVQSVPLLVGNVLVCNPISFLLDFFFLLLVELNFYGADQ